MTFFVYPVVHVSAYITSHAVLMNMTKEEEICPELTLFSFGCISVSNLSNVFLDNTPVVTEKK